jgi:hypothetical protein
VAIKKMNYPQSKQDIPAKQHFAALIFKSITIPGDERSRTNPGHGYPEHTETAVEYIAFINRKEMEEWVIQEEGRGYCKKVYQIIEVTPLNIKTKIVVE